MNELTQKSIQLAISFPNVSYLTYFFYNDHQGLRNKLTKKITRWFE